MTATAESRAEGRRALRLLLIVGIADALLLIPLVIAALSDAEGAVSVLGPIHGVGFLAELYLAVRHAGRHWGWWYPAAILVTGGPLGLILGHMKASRELAEPAPA